MTTSVKYNLSQAARRINIEKMGKMKIYKLLRELSIVDGSNKPVQSYIEEGYLDFGLPTIRIPGMAVQTPVVLVVGDRGLSFLRNTVQEYLLHNSQPIIYRRNSKIMEINGDIITFRHAFE
ncbi:MAG TPA: hypothetical protein DHV48_07730 [Prolixibacteraceae bacterium]|nr:hypothetical protein [Prolixibacteraceae bacterium]